jgi:thiol-disulfide isomerase/thioredoxin
MSKDIKIFVVVIVVLLLGVVGLAVTQMNSSPASNEPGKYDAFATCLKEKGAVFYGAFWCPHCQTQKKMFGSSAKLLPYVECSTADGNAQTQECNDKKITGYPTWEFADGSRLDGEIPLLVKIV